MKGIRIDPVEARRVLGVATDLADSDERLPSEWIEFAEFVYSMDAKTYAVALVTSLLAKATDERVDPLSIKASYSPFSFSLRTLGHSVVVPEARRLGFSIRASGREPLNNQPFFRYDHMSEISRVRNSEQHESFIRGLSKVQDFNYEAALSALAATLRVASDSAYSSPEILVGDLGASVAALIRRCRDFTAPQVHDRPRRLQAFGAACLDINYQDVRSRRINDPSRDLPGDVHVFDADNTPILAMEVRGKLVLANELIGFADACAEADIYRAVLFVDFPKHRTFLDGVRRHWMHSDEQTLISVFESAEDLLLDSIAWANCPSTEVVHAFSNALLQRLREIEATDETCSAWMTILDQNS